MIAGAVGQGGDVFEDGLAGLLVAHGVERHIELAALAMDDRAAVTLGLPGERNYGLFGVRELKDIDGDVLLAHAEDFEAHGHGLLRLGLALHQHGQVVTLGMPEHAGGVDVEEGLLTDLTLLRHLEEEDPGGLVALFGGGGVDGHDGVSRTPIELLYIGDLHRGLVQETHSRGLVNRDGVATDTGEEAVVFATGPLENGPAEGANGGVEVISAGLEETEDLGSGDVMDLKENIARAADIVTGAGEGDEIGLIGGEVRETDILVAETVDALEVRATPNGNTLGVEGGEIGSTGRPLDETLRPLLALIDTFGATALAIVPEDLGLGAMVTHGVQDELVTAETVDHVAGQHVGRLVVGARLGLVFFWDPVIPLKVIELVDTEAMVLIELEVFQGLHSSIGILSRVIFNEAETFSDVGLILRNVNTAFTNRAGVVKNFSKNTLKLIKLLSANLRNVNNN
mmetsp:Transcript_32658/g.59214  ORF Transcript_32658/g.59214 Transcript_32658/m.59214 type:complete len:455 (+) Transcript_32658:776-2140(+)